jgi:hypothetical protein
MNQGKTNTGTSKPTSNISQSGYGARHKPATTTKAKDVAPLPKKGSFSANIGHFTGKVVTPVNPRQSTTRETNPPIQEPQIEQVEDPKLD